MFFQIFLEELFADLASLLCCLKDGCRARLRGHHRVKKQANKPNEIIYLIFFSTDFGNLQSHMVDIVYNHTVKLTAATHLGSDVASPPCNPEAGTRKPCSLKLQRVTLS